jgi:hypothetical protein
MYINKLFINRNNKYHFNLKERNRTMRKLIILVVVIGVFVFCISGCHSVQKVELSQVSAPARAAIEKLTTGGQIKMIEKETSNGKTIYDVEATVNGKNVEYDIAESGEILTSE